ncbi:MAG: DUF58 domain-containing protein [Deinococcales bacterium]
MLSERSRALLEHYHLASRALSQSSGEKLSRESGQSVEFHDFRPYQPGDELRYVDWQVYARSRRLYTRLYQAERNSRIYILVDNSPSMQLSQKSAYARSMAELLSYAAKHHSSAQIYLFDGRFSPVMRQRGEVVRLWKFLEEALAQESTKLPVEAIKDFALRAPTGGGLVLIISDLFDEVSLRGALLGLRARAFDASFLHLISQNDLNPEATQLQLEDSENGEKLLVSPEEVKAYQQAVRQFIKKSRSAILEAGFRHVLLEFAETSADKPNKEAEQSAFAALVKAGILVKG